MILCCFSPQQLQILWFLVDRGLNISLALSMKFKCLLILPLLLTMKSLHGDYISHDDFSDLTLDMNKWDTLAWSGGYEQYIENNRVVFKGSDNVSNLGGSCLLNLKHYQIP